jgi:hypothetical protein
VTRPNAIGWFIVAFFLIGGIAFWVALPWVGIGQIWVAVAVGIGALYLFMGRRAGRAEALRTTGLPGQAQILEMTQTGVYINESPQVKLKLQIQATGIPPYQLEKRITVPLIALGMLGSGRPLTVYVDPSDHEKVFFDWSAAAAGGVAVPGGGDKPGPAPPATSDGHERPGVERLVELQQMRDKGLISEADFQATKDRILKSL